MGKTAFYYKSLTHRKKFCQVITYDTAEKGLLIWKNYMQTSHM